MTDEIKIGDACIELADGETVVVVDVCDETAGNYPNKDLLGTYGNQRLGVQPDDRVFEVVYATSIQSRPKKPYAFPESRLVRVETEAAFGERVQTTIKRQFLAEMFNGLGKNTKDSLMSIAMGSLDGSDDLVREAKRLAETRPAADD